MMESSNSAIPASIAITAIGANSAIGPNAALNWAAINAGIIRVRRHSYLYCLPNHPGHEAPLPLMHASSPELPEQLMGPNRLIKLAQTALQEMVAGAQIQSLKNKKGKVFLAVPNWQPASQDWNLSENFAQNLSLPLSNITLGNVIAGDRSASFLLLQQAIKAIHCGDCDFCILGAVDSYLFEERLEMLDASQQLKSQRNRDGFIPGEGAAFILIERLADAQARQVTAFAVVNGLGIANEPQPQHSGQHSSGVGLTTAIRQACGNYNVAKVSQALADLNGQSYLAFEWGIAQTRSSDHFEHHYQLRHPSQHYGDIGCATGTMLMAMAALQLKPISGRAQTHLIIASSEDSHRCAVTLSSIT